MKAKWVSVALLATYLLSCTGGEKKSEGTSVETMADTVQVSVDSLENTATVDTVPAVEEVVADTNKPIDVAEVKAIWEKAFRKFDKYSDSVVYPNKKAYFDIDGDGINEVIYADLNMEYGISCGYVCAFTHTDEDGLKLIDFNHAGGETTYFGVNKGGYVVSQTGTETSGPTFYYHIIVNSKVDKTYVVDEGGYGTIIHHGKKFKVPEDSFKKLYPDETRYAGIPWEEFHWLDSGL